MTHTNRANTVIYSTKSETRHLPVTLRAALGNATEANIRWYVVELTPQLAQDLLDDPSCSPSVHAYTNRHPMPARVKRYAELMKAGKWKLNAEPIIFSAAGARLNGEHRLLAIVQSGVTVRVCIAIGVDPSAFHTIDQGKNRTPGDIIGIAGFSNATATAAVVTTIAKYETMQWANFERDNEEMIAFVRDHADAIRESVNYCNCVEIGCGFRLLPRSALAALHYLTRQAGFGALADQFWEQLAKGTGLQENDAAYRLRQVLTNYQNRGASQVATDHKVALTIKAFNYHVSGKAVKILHYRDGEQFPEIMGRPPRGSLNGGA